MGYSTNISTLEAQMEHLAMLRKGLACVWTVDPAVAPTFAYKIREALWIAANIPAARDKYPDLAKVHGHFKIVITGPGRVEAQVKQSRYAASLEPLRGGVSTTGGELAGKARPMMGPQTASSIIQAWLDTQPSNDKYFFPQAQLSPQELMKLHAWSSSRGWIFFESNGAITLQPKSSDVAEFAWSPEDLQPDVTNHDN